MKYLKKYALYLLFAVAVIAGEFLQTSNLVTGKPPVILKHTLGGIPVEALIGKGPAILYFWGEWCGVCTMMQQSISAVSADYPLLSVALRSGTDATITQYLQRKQLPWSVINDPYGDISQQFGVAAVPALFFIDADGMIRFTSIGYTSEWGMRARLWLAGLL